MIEQVAVACDDCLGARVMGERHQVVIVRVAQHRLDLARVLVLDGRRLDVGGNFRQVVGIEAI